MNSSFDWMINKHLTVLLFIAPQRPFTSHAWPGIRQFISTSTTAPQPSLTHCHTSYPYCLKTTHFYSAGKNISFQQCKEVLSKSNDAFSSKCNLPIYLYVTMPKVLSESAILLKAATRCCWNKCSGITCPGTGIPGSGRRGSITSAPSSYTVRPLISSRSLPKYCE